MSHTSQPPKQSQRRRAFKISKADDSWPPMLLYLKRIAHACGLKESDLKRAAASLRIPLRRFHRQAVLHKHFLDPLLDFLDIDATRVDHVHNVLRGPPHLLRWKDFGTSNSALANYFDAMAKHGGSPLSAYAAHAYQKLAYQFSRQSADAQRAGNTELAQALSTKAMDNNRQMWLCKLQVQREAFVVDLTPPWQKRSNIKKARKEATIWRTIHNLPFDIPVVSNDQRMTDPLVLFIRAQKCDAIMDDLHYNQNYRLLAQLANTGNSTAAHCLRACASEAVALLNESLRLHPEAYENLVPKLTRWPVLAFSYPRLKDKVLPLLKQMNWGSDSAFIVDSHADWDPDEGWCTIAIRLFSILELVRCSPSESRSPPPFELLAAKLPEFTRDTAAVWWEAAEVLFRDLFPQPAEHNLLRSFVSSTDKFAWKSPGRLRKRMLERIKSRFIKLAPLVVEGSAVRSSIDKEISLPTDDEHVISLYRREKILKSNPQMWTGMYLRWARRRGVTWAPQTLGSNDRTRRRRILRSCFKRVQGLEAIYK